MSREEAKKEATIEVRKARTKKERERGETKRKGKPEKKRENRKGERDNENIYKNELLHKKSYAREGD